MSVEKGPDPVTPILTFDNYVIPETVKEEHLKAGESRMARPHLAIPKVAIPNSFSIPNVSFPDLSKVPFPKSQMRKSYAGLRVTPMMLSLGTICFLTFVLGVLTALYFSKPGQPIAEAPLPAAEDSTKILPLPEGDPHIEMQAENTVGQNTVAGIVTSENTLPAARQEHLKVADTANLERIVTASLERGVTRGDSADLITPSGSMSLIDTSELSLTEIIFGLTPIPNKLDEPANGQQNILNQDKLRMLREGVLAGNYTVKTVKRNGTQRLCLQLPGLKVSQDEAADLLKVAAEKGKIELPESVSTSDGNFDADTLIFSLVQTSLANDGTKEGIEAAKEMSRRAFAASNAKVSKENGERMYEVKAGDSLAYLSLQFYGQPSLYTKIFQANRKLLSSPDKIQIGQRLIIPG